MKPKLPFALIVFGVIAFITQTLSAAQVLVVASNGKWDMEYDGDPYGNVNALAAKALAACKAKGGTDPQIVWWQAINIFGVDARIAHGSIAISDNGCGTSGLVWVSSDGLSSRLLRHAFRYSVLQDLQRVPLNCPSSLHM